MKSDDIIKISNVAGKGEKEIQVINVVEIMEARIQEMLYLIKSELEKNNLLNHLGAGIVITGGGLFNIKGIQDYAQDFFDIPVRFGYPNYIGVANPTYSASAGIAMYVLKQKKNSTIHVDSKKINRVLEENEESSSIDETEENKTNWIEKVKEFFADFF